MGEHQETARQAVRAELARRQWDDADLVRSAGLDQGTVSDFLTGARWPRRSTLAKIDAALGWPAGTLDATSRTGQDPAVRAVQARQAESRSAVEEIFEVMADRVALSVSRSSVADLTPIELEEAGAAAAMAYLAKVREIRAHRARLAHEGLVEDSGDEKPSPSEVAEATHLPFRPHGPIPDVSQAAARRGAPDHGPDTTTGEESQEAGGDEPA